MVKCEICGNPLIPYNNNYVCKECNIEYKIVKGKLVDIEGGIYAGS